MESATRSTCETALSPAASRWAESNPSALSISAMLKSKQREQVESVSRRFLEGFRPMVELNKRMNSFVNFANGPAFNSPASKIASDLAWGSFTRDLKWADKNRKIAGALLGNYSSISWSKAILDRHTKTHPRSLHSLTLESFQERAADLAIGYLPRMFDPARLANQMLGKTSIPSVLSQRSLTGPSPTLRAIETARRKFEEQRLGRLASSVTIEQLFPRIESSWLKSFSVDSVLGKALVAGLETSREVVECFYDYWFKDRQRSPEFPPPIMFLLSKVPAQLATKIYEAERRNDDSLMLELLEQVLADPEYLDDLQAAVVKAPVLHEPAREQLIEGLKQTTEGKYSIAYPNLYAGLEPAFFETARAEGIIDAKNHFLDPYDSGKARKVEDLLAWLQLSPSYRKYLRSWIFSEVGNDFRHGDVSDPARCRRQSLLLVGALVGWLEEIGGWSDAELPRRIESASRQLLIATD